MRRLQLHEIVLPLFRPFTNATGTITERRTILVGISRDGVCGWGEAAPYPGITDETIEGVWSNLVGEVAAILDGGSPALTPSAAAAVDEAECDIAAQQAAMPLWNMLEGRPGPVAAGMAIGSPDDAESTLSQIRAAMDQGIAAFKLKITPDSDIGIIRHIREVVGDADLAVDANGAFHIDNPFFDAIDDLGLDYIEQPLGATQLHEHAVLRQRIETAVCLDESVGSAVLARRAIDMRAADIICLKPARLGLNAATELARHARAAELDLKASGMLESTIGKAHTLALASVSGFSHIDLTPPSLVFDADPCGAAFALVNGRFELPTRPGLGFAPDPTQLAEIGRRSLTLSR